LRLAQPVPQFLRFLHPDEFLSGYAGTVPRPAEGGIEGLAPMELRFLHPDVIYRDYRGGRNEVSATNNLIY